jgi:Cd2+/Zn2+-exporting ATPase
MAHEHLHFKQDIAVEHTHGKQVRVSLALLGTLAGGMLLLSHYVGKWFIYGPDAFQTELLAFVAAILLGSPIIWHAIKSLAHKEAHMDELVAIAILAAIATRQYP